MLYFLRLFRKQCKTPIVEACDYFRNSTLDEIAHWILRGDVTIFCGIWFSVHNFTILQYFPLIKVSYCSSFKELSIDVLILYVAYLLFMLQVQTVSWVKKTY